MASRLNQETVNQIQGNPDLFAAVSKGLKVKPASLATILQRNSTKRLTEYSILKVISDFTGKSTGDLIEENAEVVS